ncbi:class 1 fructose-bisphosphatase [bacterium]|nr:class 1 fructose-bisphosphatase [bacterium]
MSIPTETLSRFILRSEAEHPEATGELSDLLTSIGVGVKMIGHLVASAGFSGVHGYTGRKNVQGEQTHQLDEDADEILVDLLGSSGHFGSLVSEERDGVLETEAVRNGAKYVVAFDPLDGSSNIGSNIPVGTIFTIFRVRDDERGATQEDFLQQGREVVAAGYSVYGAKTSFVYSAGNGVHGFTLDRTIGEFVLTEESMKMPKRGSIYSVNEGYWEKWSEKLQAFISSLRSQANRMGYAYTGRYVGSLVADFDRTLRKGGIFLHPGNVERPGGKLRLLYECIPLAFIAQQADGCASDGPTEILDILPNDIHERCPFIVGGEEESQWFREEFSDCPCR